MVLPTYDSGGRPQVSRDSIYGLLKNRNIGDFEILWKFIFLRFFEKTYLESYKCDWLPIVWACTTMVVLTYDKVWVPYVSWASRYQSVKITIFVDFSEIFFLRSLFEKWTYLFNRESCCLLSIVVYTRHALHVMWKISPHMLL